MTGRTTNFPKPFHRPALAGIGLAAVALAIPLDIAAAQEDAEEALAARDLATMEQRTEQLGLSVGNTYVCLEGEPREALNLEAQMIFDLLLKDQGSNLAFHYAAAAGYGASVPREELDCEALEESWDRIRADFGLDMGEGGQ